jgi:hypothetical protein
MEIVSGGEIGCVELRVVVVGKVTTLVLYGVLPVEQELNTKNLIMRKTDLEVASRCGTMAVTWWY